MDRYFFDIRRDGETVRDDEGDEYPSDEEARANAIKAVRELVAAKIRGGFAVSDEHLDVCDKDGRVLFSISFHDVVHDQLKR